MTAVTKRGLLISASLGPSNTISLYLILAINHAICVWIFACINERPYVSDDAKHLQHPATHDLLGHAVGSVCQEVKKLSLVLLPVNNGNNRVMPFVSDDTRHLLVPRFTIYSRMRLMSLVTTLDIPKGCKVFHASC